MKYSITTAIHYVNDLPHIGHIYENVTADVAARYHRLIGDDVFFLTGTDEHGQKIQRSAEKEGIAPIELADRVVRNHHELWKTLAISHDDFIRTTEPRHKAGVYELIRRIRERNPDDLYVGEHSGWYCQSEEAFIPDSQLVDGLCPDGHKVEKTTERNYFFRLSAWEKPLLDFYRANPGFVRPKTRFNEIISFVEQGLKDLSVSRTSISWGIPFPDDPEHVIYVWMDALTNYISAMGFGSNDQTLLEKYWPVDVHLIGKDIVRFHAVYWPAFLMSAGIELPKSIIGHGWWLRDDQKISKSTGNIVRPNHIIERFGPDALRYYMTREMSFGQDANYSDEAFVQRFNADLANDLGNTLSRALKMSRTYFDGSTPPVECGDSDIRTRALAVIPRWRDAMDGWNFQRALDEVWDLLNSINAYIVAREPWKHYKEKGADESLSRILWNALEGLRLVWVMMSPVMPRVSSAAFRQLGIEPESTGARALEWGSLQTGLALPEGEALFPRIDQKQFLEEISMTSQDKSGPPIDTTQAANPAATRSDDTASPPPAGGTGVAPRETTEAQPPDATEISIDEFFQTKLRVAEILEAERVEKSNKLVKLRVSTGDGERTVVAGIGKAYDPAELVGRKVVIVANLKPAKLMGIESQGMILAASVDGVPSLLGVDPAVPPGTEVR
ncbi:MAG: methionine--tRNA ligase [Acidobacteria bacterium]|nr:methionine--tRNA ligase [Acidobacteriota bacterium]